MVGFCASSTVWRSSTSQRGLRCTRSRVGIRPVRMCAEDTRSSLKVEVLKAIEGVGEDRGIFGMDRDERGRIDELLKEIEGQCPYEKPTEVIEEVVAGRWRVIYTTLTILGAKRTKLAIGTSTKPGLVKLGELFQEIDSDAQIASNIVEFEVMGKVSGTFTITAGYSPSSDQRVDVKLDSSELKPAALEKLLGQNINLLTQIFNPEGFLDITYVDDTLRIGRDHSERVFVLVRD